MTLILVVPGGGRSNVIAAGMAAAAGARGARVNLGAIQTNEIDATQFARTVAELSTTVDMVIVYVEPQAWNAAFVYRVCDAIESADIDLVLHVASSVDTDVAVETVDALREVDIEPSGLVLDAAPADNANYVAARQFLAAAAGVPVIGALPVGAEALEPEEFARHAVRWFDEDDSYDE